MNTTLYVEDVIDELCKKKHDVLPEAVSAFSAIDLVDLLNRVDKLIG
jgi:hypothetical protein